MPNLFFTSDTHFGHNNILKLGNKRPFNTIEEHDQTLIDNWNKVVGKGDIVFHLGDFSMNYDQEKIENTLKQLNGQKHLILGNHDRTKIQYKFLNNNLWQSVRDYHKLKWTLYNGKEITIILKHFPILEFDGAFRKDSIHLYGHIHDINNYDDIYNKLGFKAAHIGVDTSSNFKNTAKYSPINIEDIWEHLNGDN